MLIFLLTSINKLVRYLIIQKLYILTNKLKIIYLRKFKIIYFQKIEIN